MLNILTVKELISELQRLDQERWIFINNDGLSNDKVINKITRKQIGFSDSKMFYYALCSDSRDGLCIKQKGDGDK